MLCVWMHAIVCWLCSACWPVLLCVWYSRACLIYLVVISWCVYALKKNDLCDVTFVCVCVCLQRISYLTMCATIDTSRMATWAARSTITSCIRSWWKPSTSWGWTPTKKLVITMCPCMSRSVLWHMEFVIYILLAFCACMRIWAIASRLCDMLWRSTYVTELIFHANAIKILSLRHRRCKDTYLAFSIVFSLPTKFRPVSCS